MKLSEAVRSAPWELGMPFVIDPAPGLRPDVAGDPPDRDAMAAALCCGDEGRYLACVADDWDHAFAASHELVEARCGHTHTQELFELQASLLAHWCVELARPPKRGVLDQMNKLIAGIHINYNPPPPERIVFVPYPDPRGGGMRA